MSGYTLPLAVALLAVIVWVRSRTYARRYPPGPPAKPLVGNIMQIPGINEFFEFDRHRQLYGACPISMLPTVNVLPPGREVMACD